MTEEEKLKLEVENAKGLEINLYKEILELRKFEIENFWKRTLFFWGTIAIVLAGYFKADLNDKYLVFISFLGIIYNTIFSMSIRGSKFWQEHWETMAVVYENSLNFSLLKKGTSQIIDNKNKSSLITYPYRFSVSKLTMLLSDITVLLWVMFWLKDIYKLVKNKLIFFDFCCKNEFHPFTISLILFHLIIGYYIYLFFKKGKVFYKVNEN